MICVVTLLDEDNEEFMTVTHTVCDYIMIKQDNASMELSYAEARSLIRALQVILEEAKDNA